MNGSCDEVFSYFGAFADSVEAKKISEEQYWNVGAVRARIYAGRPNGLVRLCPNSLEFGQ